MPAQHVAHRVPVLPGVLVRPELVDGEPERPPAGQRVAQRGAERDQRVAAVAAAEGGPDRDRRAAAGRRHHRAGGDRHGVGGDQLFGFDHVRQRGGQRRQDEPVHRDHHQRAEVERLAVHAGADLGGDAAHQQRAQQVGAEQHPLPRPAVQQHAGERAEQRVGQQQHGEAGGDITGVRLALRVEQDGAGQRGLEDAVGELPEHPHRQQPPEVTPAEQPASDRRVLPINEHDLSGHRGRSGPGCPDSIHYGHALPIGLSSHRR